MREVVDGEGFTLVQIRDWLKAQPADETYSVLHGSTCLMTQFAKAHIPGVEGTFARGALSRGGVDRVDPAAYVGDKLYRLHPKFWRIADYRGHFAEYGKQDATYGGALARCEALITQGEV